MKKSAFSLIEMIVVVTIIGIIIAVALPDIMRGIERSKIARIVSESKSIRTAAYSMYADTGFWPGSNWSNDYPEDPLAGAAKGEGFMNFVDDADMPNGWLGPYLEKWIKHPWGGWYWWDYNENDQNGDGVGGEHVLWIDNRRGNSGNRIPLASRFKIDETLDDGNLRTGRVQVWQGNNTRGNLGFILIQGE
ncbi:MAG: prepilin-type N-terminal cleavage/methylation domain-containing protein [Candidatus Omnitrophica bacterium]|nr:prepilin-type N-terminal cleavage/methylation domain-containing protein [Candidatus Omnitrophota bacterium]